MTSQRNFPELIAQILGAVGALNWGAVGLTDHSLVDVIFGRGTFASRLVYTLVGLAGLWGVYHLFQRTPAPVNRSPIANFFSRVA